MIRTATIMLSVLAGAAVAQDRKILEAQFRRFDADADGQVERAEFPGSDHQFAAIDRDRDGRISFDEYRVSAVARQLLAARNRDASAPRQRVDLTALVHRRLEAIPRFDDNHDGRVQRDEWRGTQAAFDSLDLDRDGVLDKADKTIAAKAFAEEQRATPAGRYARFKARLPAPEDIFRRYDRNRDELLTRAEVGKASFAELFEVADTDRDGLLGMNEVRAMCRAVQRMVRERNYGAEKARAFRVPFSTWDKNHDDRLDSGEWLTRKDLFGRIDLDRDGAVTEAEVARYERAVEGDTFLEKFDLDNDGKVTVAEFGGSPDAFRRADRNHDGIVTRSDR